jgi:L-lactate dehydrogenase
MLDIRHAAEPVSNQLTRFQSKKQEMLDMTPLDKGNIVRNSEGQPHSRIAIIGAGHVGSTLAYGLLLSGLASEIVIVDKDVARAEGEVMDLNHAVPLSRETRIWVGEYQDCASANIIVVTAGANQHPGETRLDLLQRNVTITQQIIEGIMEHGFNGLFLIATNPVDVLTQVVEQVSGLPASRVIGSGTILDTARFRYGISRYLGVDAHSVHAHIIGEHGDSEVPVWSLANIAGMGLDDYVASLGIEWHETIRDEIFQQTRDAAYHIIQRKGSTYYAVATGLVRIIEAILRDQNTVLCVSSKVENYLGISDVCLSLPTIINRQGIVRQLHLNLSDEEADGLRHSAETLKNALSQATVKAGGG